MVLRNPRAPVSSPKTHLSRESKYKVGVAGTYRSWIGSRVSGDADFVLGLPTQVGLGAGTGARGLRNTIFVRLFTRMIGTLPGD